VVGAPGTTLGSARPMSQPVYRHQMLDRRARYKAAGEGTQRRSERCYLEFYPRGAGNFTRLP
jgi:hypothetical protein